MFKYVFCALLLFYNSAFSQTNNIEHEGYVDTINYLIHIDSAEGVSFTYPAHWDTTKFSQRAIFTAFEKLTSPNHKFREELLFGKVLSSYDLKVLQKHLAQAIKGQNRKIVIGEQEIKLNSNNVRYSIFKSTSLVKGYHMSVTHIFFRNGKYVYYLTLDSDLEDENIYTPIFNRIIQSIKLIN